MVCVTIRESNTNEQRFKIMSRTMSVPSGTGIMRLHSLPKSLRHEAVNKQGMMKT